jgi:hypothetical protein
MDSLPEEGWFYYTVSFSYIVEPLSPWLLY